MIILTLIATVRGDSLRNVDVSDPKVVETGKFAVLEHNKLANADLRFDRVLQAQTRLAGNGVGVEFHERIQATDPGTGLANVYKAVVLEKPLDHPSMNLQSFEKVH
ncbi:PREDICTED: cysteine proteinase inhibitor 5-like [Tarenaya hassleriana]|uniref:cysteine proteinase inhibitor 5-like n=1 Tax=Tarenaya hassleriana TaxID=28532 RepID=UPI00053C63F5|nr:PREDICTED: cysteine proteinase inhibitor 5-like [Tarenaya hassleriana]